MKVAPEILRSTAHAAVDARLESGMTVGLGSGTAASLAVERIGELLSSGELEDVRGIPTSEKTARLAREVGIPLLDLSASGPDVTIDGADEIGEGNLSLIKGHGGALLREKIVASCSYLVVVADARPRIARSGDKAHTRRPGVRHLCRPGQGGVRGPRGRYRHHGSVSTSCVVVEILN